MEHVIGERIEARRKSLRVSVLALSRETGIARTTLARKIENPETFTLYELNRIGDALGFNPLEDDAA